MHFAILHPLTLIGTTLPFFIHRHEIFTQATLIILLKHFWIATSDVEQCGDESLGCSAITNTLSFISTLLNIRSSYLKMENTLV